MEKNQEKIQWYQKLAKSLTNKFDPGFDRLLTSEKIRGNCYKNMTYEKLMELSPEDPRWVSLSKVYFNEPQYQRIILYYAALFLGYYYVSPVDIEGEKINKKSLEKEYREVLRLLDDEINVENFTLNVLVDILTEGETFYYYDFINLDGKPYLQMCKLPTEYCRIIGNAKNNQMPIFELDLNFITKLVSQLGRTNKVITEETILKQYPRGLRAAYLRMKNNGDSKIIITPASGIGFRTYNGLPPFATIIRQLARIKKFEDVRDNYIEDSLQKILFQHVEVDENGDPEIDLALAAQFHDNLKRITKSMQRVNALTSLADVSVLDLSDTSRQGDLDFISKFEDKMYNEAGVPKAIFDGQTAGLVDYSTQKDESFMWGLLGQISIWLSFISSAEIGARGKRKYNFVVSYLPVSYRNREKMMDTYLKNAQYGYSKLLPQIAVGVKQRHFESLLYLENDLLKLDKRLVPLTSSHTLSGGGSEQSSAGTSADGTEKKNGRPKSSTEEKTDGTLEKEGSQ